MKKLLLATMFCAASLSAVFANAELQAACDSGDWEKCVELGMKYYRGQDGLEKDHEKAHQLYENACETGHNLNGCYRAGLFYAVGQGTEHDHDKALLWLKKACDGGHEKACKTYERVLHEE